MNYFSIKLLCVFFKLWYEKSGWWLSLMRSGNQEGSQEASGAGIVWFLDLGVGYMGARL